MAWLVALLPLLIKLIEFLVSYFQKKNGKLPARFIAKANVVLQRWEEAKSLLIKAGCDKPRTVNADIFLSEQK